jgi:hypothetical protein
MTSCAQIRLRHGATATLSVARSSLGFMADVRGRYEDLVDDLMGIDGVTPPAQGSGFGRGALRYQGKIFAMLVRGRLVVKLPADRVTVLINSGDGAAFDANKGTPMREWLSLDADSALNWLELTTEAVEFARAMAPRSR